MKHLKHISIISALTIFAFINNSCTTDFELNAPYDEIPVIFGILDQSADTQFVKINKSFIGGGDNVSYAAINDSSLYTNVVGTVEEYIDDPTTPTRTFNLQEKWVDNLDAGIFYTDSQKVFYFVPVPKLDENATYKIIVNTAEESAPITAETDLVKGSDLAFDYLFTLGATNLLQYNGGIKFADASSISSGDYLSVTPSWQTVSNGKNYELKMRLNFTEITATDSTNKFIEWNLGSQKAVNLSGGKNLNKIIEGAAFFDMVDSKLTGYASEAYVLRRNLGDVEFILTAGNDNLNTYMEINEPASGVVTERPEYTNIDGGVGIFASRFSSVLTTYLHTHTAKVLCSSLTTSGYKFCINSLTPFGSDITSVTNYPEIKCYQ